MLAYSYSRTSLDVRTLVTFVRVRVTGQLLLDSEHFIKNHLVRVNNWEIHPVMKLEFCET
jgi:hypothetical protein